MVSFTVAFFSGKCQGGELGHVRQIPTKQKKDRVVVSP